MYTVYCIQYKHTLNHIKFIYVLHCLSKIEMSQQSYGPSTPPASQVRKVSHSGRASRPKWLSRSSSSGHRPATHCRPHSSMLQLNIVTTCDNMWQPNGCQVFPHFPHFPHVLRFPHFPPCLHQKWSTERPHHFKKVLVFVECNRFYPWFWAPNRINRRIRQEVLNRLRGLPFLWKIYEMYCKSL